MTRRPASAYGIWPTRSPDFGILLVPVFAVFLFAGRGHDTGWRIAAWAAYAAAAFTDRLDGQIARSRGLVTEFGKLADPIADKALVGTALIGLSILGELSWWVTAIVLAREIGVTLLRFWVLRHGVIPASRGGKLKTLLLNIGIGLYVLPLSGALHVVAAVILGRGGGRRAGHGRRLRRHRAAMRRDAGAR